MTPRSSLPLLVSVDSIAWTGQLVENFLILAILCGEDPHARAGHQIKTWPLKVRGGIRHGRIDQHCRFTPPSTATDGVISVLQPGHPYSGLPLMQGLKVNVQNQPLFNIMTINRPAPKALIERTG
ncbi:hypothetical protein [Rahnella perminowiae]|uniref:hypothetical protein n=1 Tax=Rahnella perminowiae TaxID=2816244 RepID=UPI001EE5F5D9|nr:hypothetical protein [Rahnella perminowiae]